MKNARAARTAPTTALGTCLRGVCASSARNTAVSKPEKPVIAIPTPSARSPRLTPCGVSDFQASPSAPPFTRIRMSKITSSVTPMAVSDSRTHADSWMPKYDTAITPTPRITAQRTQLGGTTVGEPAEWIPGEPVSSRAMAAIDDHHVDVVGLGEKRVDEREARCPCADDEV